MRMTRLVLAMLGLAGLAGPPSSARAGVPSADQLAESVQLGSVAALAQVCGLRDESWAADLRRGAIQSATRSTAHDDGALKAAPGSELVVGALSYAEAEALESFAEAPPAETCGPLTHSPALRQADAMVRHFRDQSVPSS